MVILLRFTRLTQTILDTSRQCSGTAGLVPDLVF